jgi:hypothetical protein
MSDSKVTYELSDEYDAKTFGGNFALRSGELYDVAAELKKGSGKIVTDDEHLITALDAYHGVVRASASKAPAKSED